MSWINLIIEAQQDEAEALSEALSESGALAVSVDDADAGTDTEQPIFGEPGMAQDALWSRCRITALLPADADVRDCLAQACRIARLAAVPDFLAVPLDDADWVRVTQAQFAPIRILPELWIVPSWHELPDPAAINIRLDPGVAFGTGSHPTTRLCLRWIAEHVHGGEQVVDYGCGSGILAIAALKLGAREALGIDIDPQALEAARRNASDNGVVISVSLPTPEPAFAADVTLANILSNPLKLLAPVLAKHTRPGGRIVLSGILSEQHEAVVTHYTPWFEMSTYGEEEGWVCLQGEKRTG